MKIYAICVVKNEADIIEYSLLDASRWADKVIVFDNGSTDGTWEKVKGLHNSKIVAFKQNSRPYSDGLRAEIFNSYKNELSDGDWWVIQDADEIYKQDPRQFIERQKGYFHHINGKKIDFSFNLKRIDRISFTNDFLKDIIHITHYTPEAWSEPRAIKHRKSLVWEEKKIWPTHMGLVCQNTIHIKHYPLRSANQIRVRWLTRKQARDSGGQHFDHWEKEDWREYYRGKAKDLIVIRNEEEIFKSVKFANNPRQSFAKRLVKQILHRTQILP